MPNNASPYVNCWTCIGPTNILGHDESYNSFGCPSQAGSERDINMDHVGATVQCVESGSGQLALARVFIHVAHFPVRLANV